MLSAEAKLYLYLGAAWVENHDVLPNPPLTWEYGIEGAGPTDLLASTGFLNAYLDNSRSNSAALDGLYSPDHANLLANFAKGIKCKVTLPNHGDWDKKVDAVGDFDAETDPDNHLNDSVAAAHDGAVGLEVTFVDTNVANGRMDLPAIDQTSLLCLMWFDFHDAVLTGAEVLDIVYVYDGTPTTNLQLRIQAGVLIYYADDDAHVAHTVGTWAIEAGYHNIALYAKAATAPGANDGIAYLFIDGVSEGSKIDLDNDTIDYDYATFGMNYTTAATPGGSFYIDTIRLSDKLEQVKFIGNISAIRPASGLFEHPAVEIEALDWIGYLSDQELGILPVQETKRADQALTTALTSFPIQPITTDFDTGVQTFLLVFDTEDPKSTMASFFQKMCRNELGRVYSKGNGTLRFEKQGARALITYPDFELDGIMTEFITSYERADVFNIIQATITPVEASLLPDVLLWDCKVAEYFGGVIPSIAAGETLILNCPFTDPALNTTISAINVVDPIVNIEFGSVADFESNDMIGDLVWSQTIGANATIVSLENTHATATGYLNDLQIYGRALYTYGNQTLESRDQTSIDSGIGERRFVLRLEEIADVETALAFAVIVKDRYCDPHIRSRRINFLANQEFEVLHGAIAIEPSTRFTATESVTGVSKDFYVNRIKYTVRGPWLWVDVFADPVRI